MSRYKDLNDEQKALWRANERARYAKRKDEICARRRALKSQNREACNAKAREYMRRNKDAYYEYNAANRFGVKRADIQAIVASSDVCEICGYPPDTRRLAIDHDHDTGKLRGMLCHTCNLGLGAFKDDPERLMNAILYLAPHKPMVRVA